MRCGLHRLFCDVNGELVIDKKKEKGMIIYDETKVGDILRIIGKGAPGYAGIGDLVRVKEVHKLSVIVENRDGKTAEFSYNCGAARLEPTEWKKDYTQDDIDIISLTDKKEE